ncbi:hypothetical protein [Dyella ginsengisoli]|uniref:hypothetical protein n=1 Tax=Dyella ginsengisoli TaxID=363848 RepID=UPI000345DB91|nr:hypothetical protein [Dyella ginsengisoli]
MSTAASSVSLPPPSSLARAAGWYREGFRLWRRAPFRLVGLSLACMVAEVLLQLVPLAGTVLSKAVVPMLAVGVWIGLDRLARGEPLRFACLLSGWRHPRWPALWGLSAAVGLIVFAVQVAAAAAVYGPAVWDAVVLGHLLHHPALQTRRMEFVLLLPGLVPATLLTLAPPLFLFRGEGVLAALAGSLRRVAAHAVAFTLALLPQLVLFAVALSSPWAMPLLLLLMPLGTLLAYAAWRDLAGAPPAG